MGIKLGDMKSLYEEVGGHPVIERVHKIFYDKVYAHPWLKHFFEGTSQDRIEKQQTDFMVSIMGGPKRFMGSAPKVAHLRMFITQEILDVRTKLLTEALQEAGLSTINQMAWLSKDRNFHAAIVKTSPQEAKQRYPSEQLLVIPKP